MSELIKDFEKAFENVKKDLSFKASLNELDEVFFLKDFVSEKGFVSNRLSRMICSRIVSLYSSWYNYLHGIVMPNPSYLMTIAESQMFSQDEKNELVVLMDSILAFTSLNSLIGLSNNKHEESKFIDESLSFWKKVRPKLLKVMKKVSSEWKSKSLVKPKKVIEESMFN